jgi:hypothetical protein
MRRAVGDPGREQGGKLPASGSLKLPGSSRPVVHIERPLFRPIDVHEHLAVTATAAVLAQVFEGRGHIEAAHFFQDFDGACDSPPPI